MKTLECLSLQGVGNIFSRACQQVCSSEAAEDDEDDDNGLKQRRRVAEAVRRMQGRNLSARDITCQKLYFECTNTTLRIELLLLNQLA